MLGIARRTHTRKRHSSATPVANEVALIPRTLAGVIGHCHRAGWAGHRLTARATADEMVISAAVDKEHRLLARVRHAAQFSHQLLAKGRKTAALHLTAHIGNLDRGQLGTAKAMLECDERISALFCLLIAFERRRRRG